MAVISPFRYRFKLKNEWCVKIGNEKCFVMEGIEVCDGVAG